MAFSRASHSRDFLSEPPLRNSRNTSCPIISTIKRSFNFMEGQQYHFCFINHSSAEIKSTNDTSQINNRPDSDPEIINAFF
ncbi:hypothetical protein BS413_04540 [Cronobacter malonaticus]|nr:hypothetical protein BS413_04540 [Cronobacter malonaticus]